MSDTTYHKNITGTDLHIPGYVQTTDPGAIGASKVWIDTSGGTAAWLVKIRNVADTGWETISATGIPVVDESSDTECFPAFFTSATGTLSIKTGTNLTFNSSTGLLTATILAGINTNWDAAYSHISNNGSAHSYIDQDVTSGSSPTFVGTNITGIDGTNIPFSQSGFSASNLNDAVEELLTQENLWDRTGSTLSTHYTNDDVVIGTGSFITAGTMYIDNIINIDGGLHSALTTHFTITPTGDTAGDFYAYDCVTQTGNQEANYTGELVGLVGDAKSYVTGGFTTAQLIGVRAINTISFGGTTSEVVGFHSTMTTEFGGVVTVGKGLHVENVVGTGGGTYDTYYGIYIAANLQGSTKYAVFDASGEDWQLGSSDFITTGTLGAGAATVTSLDAGSGVIQTLGNVGIGIASNSLILLRVSGTIVVPEFGLGNALALTATYDSSSGGTSGLLGSNITVKDEAEASSVVLGLIGIAGGFIISHTSGTHASAIGSQITANFTSGDGTTTLGKILNLAWNTDGSETITTGVGLWCPDITNAGTAYGLVVDSDTVGLTLGASQDVTMIGSSSGFDIGSANFTTTGTIKAGDYYSGDGTQGATGSFLDNSGNTITVKDGLITDFGT